MLIMPQITQLPPQPPGITGRAQVLLDAIQKAGDKWVMRSEIATTIGAARLTEWDFKLLARLAELGHIEIGQRPAANPQGHEWLYKAKSR